MPAELLLLVNGVDNLLLASGDDLLLASSTVSGSDASITPSPVVIQVELPQATVGGDATSGPQPLWRIGGYPLPARVSRSTGERMLANR
jgi:hypothetical protein